jgi:hypothetical protein
MQCLIVNVRRPGLSDVESIIARFRRLSEMFLFVSNEVLRACLHSSALDTADRVGEQFTSEVRVRAEALPVTTTLRGLSTRHISSCDQLGCLVRRRTLPRPPATGPS